MFDQLTGRLQRVFKTLRGEGKLSEAHVTGALREIRLALLEADVNFRVVKQFVEAVRARATGREVLQSLTPTQQVIKIVRDELVELLGGESSALSFSRKPPSVYLMVGLQGSGKTTSAGKLARWLDRNGHRPLLLSIDVYRPAAREQLAVIARDLDLPCYRGEGIDDPLQLCRSGLLEAGTSGCDVLLIDTAGRLHIDDTLMQELQQVRDLVTPTETLLVADAMTGQDAVKSAREFHERLSLSGVILTKMDGDARGGAALSIRSVTGQPVKFVGVGEKYDALELFHPDRMASRILGMGDVLSLIEKAEETIDREKALELERKVRSDSFTLEDFRDQMRQMRRLGSMEQILSMLPQVGAFKELNKVRVDEKELLHIEAIINSMTPRERAHHQIINGSRRKRIARGSGTSVQKVNQLLKRYVQARKMMKQMSSGKIGRRLGRLKLSGLR
ncbi:MAG: signal recognition particle protein [Acidobacteriota bacterium]|nr:signal recognition particle protein [Acidobacteriota bacterium]MDE2963302.1 signal recognition particle protein [Acidobacteriota bacterium]